MAAVWAAHDRAARDLLPAWRGREIDKTDGMLLLFEAASDAVQYAVAYHRALAALPVPLKARAGLHVGPVILRENSARGRGARRQAAGGRRPGQAHRGARDVAGARRADAAHARGAAGARRRRRSRCSRTATGS